MTKYIVKNCPSLRKMVTNNSKKGHETLFDSCSEGKHCLCKDRTDCSIKQVVEIVKWDNERRRHLLLPPREVNNEILQTLQVEEVE